MKRNICPSALSHEIEMHISEPESTELAGAPI